MATADNILCGICNARHINKAADHWCQACDEGLCSECQQSYHGISKGTRNHDVIDTANLKMLPTSVLEITKHCIEHNMDYQHYCPHHETLGCPVCVSSNHKKCTDLIALSELIKTSKSSTLLESIDDSLQGLKSNIKNIIQDRQQNLTRLQGERQNVIVEIKRVRDKINFHLDTLEETIITSLLATEEKAKQNIEKLLEQLQNRTIIIDELESNALAVKNYASDMQTFFASKAINKEVENEEKHMKLLFEGGSLENLTLKCSIDDKISDILSSITTFGSVTMESSPPSVPLKVGRSKQAQIMSIIQQPLPKSIQAIKLTLLDTFTIPKSKEGATTGSIVCPNGKMMFTNYVNRKLIILNKDGTPDNEIPIQSDPNDITMIDDKTVAVATNIGIYIINTVTKQTEKYIETNNRCDGITYNDNTLLWCERSKDLQILPLPGNKITTLLQQNPLPDLCYVTTYNDKIYQTNYRTNSVSCYTTHGIKMWEFSGDSLHSGPIGVAVDNDENIYVTTYQSHSVVVLTPDGNQSRKLLSQSDGMNCPWGIYFDKINENILVANSNGPAFLYHVS